MRENQERIEGAEERGKLPYFLSDNREFMEEVLKGENKTKEKVSSPLEINNKELENALGLRKGNPMTFEEANELRGNPHYDEDESYRVNCQTCVVANELRRRGFDVSALPNTKGSMNEILSGHTEMIWLDEDGNIPRSTLIGSSMSVKRSLITGKEIQTYQALCNTKEELVTLLSDSLSEDGRYHIKWMWERPRYGKFTGLQGHIITAERINREIRFYDPQNGKIIENLAVYANNLDLKRGIQFLRVDNLKINPEIAEKILAKAGANVKKGILSKDGIIGGFSLKTDKEAFKNLQKEIKTNTQGYSKDVKYNDLFYTHRMVLNRESLKAMIGHVFTEDELRAIQKLPEVIDNLTKPKYDPLRISRPNIRKKIKDGIKHFVEYEIEIDGKEYILKTKAKKNTHGQFLIEYPYFFREK